MVLNASIGTLYALIPVAAAVPFPSPFLLLSFVFVPRSLLARLIEGLCFFPLP